MGIIRKTVDANEVLDDRDLEDIIHGEKLAMQDQVPPATWNNLEKGFIKIDGVKSARTVSEIIDGQMHNFVLNCLLPRKHSIALMTCYGPKETFMQTKDVCESLVKTTKIVER